MAKVQNSPQMADAQRIAYFDRDDTAGRNMADRLRRLDLAVAHIADFGLVQSSFRQSLPSAIIITPRSLDDHGWQFAGDLRQFGEFPILALCDAEHERSKLERAGADQVLTHPIRQNALALCIKSLTRKGYHGDISLSNLWTKIDHSGLKMDSESFETTWQGAPLALTVTEFTILKALAEQPGYVRSRGFLKSMAYSDSSAVSDRTIDTYIRRLRAKFRATGAQTIPIDTVHGLGYRFRKTRQVDADTTKSTPD